MPERPGVMFYFDIRPALKYLNYEQMGRLYEAILNYGELGEIPNFEDALLGMAWSFVQPRIDRDGISYDSAVEQKKYAGFCSAMRRKKVEPIPFDEWKLLTEEERKMLVESAKANEH